MKAHHQFLIILYFILSVSHINAIEEKNTDEPLSYEELMEFVKSEEFEFRVESEENVELKDLFPVTDCLMQHTEAVRVLKNSYGVSIDDPDKNLRFILGRCNPVLLVPGIYATKILVELNCKGIATDEKRTTLKEIRLYCGKKVCPDITATKEEHPLLIALLDSAFTILGTNDDKYSACLGFIANYFQNPAECDQVDGKSTCFYSKYIKVGFYGGTTKTLENSRCGVEGVSKVIQSGYQTVDNLINLGAANSLGKISEKLIEKGYKEGFSIGGLPNDYRRFLATNNFAAEVFKSQINRLYSNTGKPVVIVAHSYGCLLTLTNLIKQPNLKGKIKKFIAMAPPFSGSSKLLDAFFHGLNDWNREVEVFGKKIRITNYNIFGQYMMYKSLPVMAELRPLPMASKIFTDSSYNELGSAIKGRLEFERDCKNKNCGTDIIKSKTSAFDNIFKGYYPSFLDSECAYESNIGGCTKTLNRKCFTGIYNVGNCPSIITKSVNPTEDNWAKDAYCNKFGNNYFYQGDCTGNRNCLDALYSSDKCPNLYKNTEAVNFLIDRFNKESSGEYGKISKSYFDSHEKIRKGVKALIDKQKRNDVIGELPVPPVDTDLLYASFAPTHATLVMPDSDFTKNGQIYQKGGDGTVPSWSSLLTGLKWIYDKKKKNLSQNIRLIEYCSRLAKSGQYKYDPSKNQKFAAIGCECLDGKNQYKDKYNGCTHAPLLTDSNVIDYITSIVDDPKEKASVTETKKQAVKTYKSNYDYTKVCDKELYNILDTAK